MQAARAARRRRKRAAGEVELEDSEDASNELNESEDEPDMDNLGVGEFEGGHTKKVAEKEGQEQEQEGDNEDTEDSYRLVDEFVSANVNFDMLDELENSADDVLDADKTEEHKFEPIDLRKTNCLVRPENQNNCGRCYSYASTAAAAYYNCVGQNEGRLERYHASFTSDCGKYTVPEGKLGWLKGCRGGRVTEAIKFQKTMGLPRFGDYNIAAVSAQVIDEDRCAFPRPEGPLEQHNWPINLSPIEHYQRSRVAILKLEEVDLHLRTVGPVVVNLRTWPEFKLYEAGIYDKKEEDPRPGLHSMLVVGHDYDAEGRDFYILWNSHGIVWGELGYLRISGESLAHYALMFIGMAPESLE